MGSSCSLAGSCLGNLLGAFSIELWGMAWACCRGREAEDSAIERTVSFAHQPQDYLALRVALGSCLCEELEE